MSDISRKEALDELKEYEEGLDLEYATTFDKAILFAINFLEDDLKMTVLEILDEWKKTEHPELTKIEYFDKIVEVANKKKPL